jgi:NIMA (never in mitosis gene a)-related kinase 1/4/5
MEKYDPIRIIGEGSFGKVYLMRDKVNRKFVCVKVIKIKNIPKKERQATKMEVDLLKRLHHPNIVRYVDSFLSKNNESLCIAMEYCDGGDLASQIKSAKRRLFSEDKILHWFVQITLGLHYMHMTKVLHRDLKTQNIFLLGNGRLVLGDLGISKVLEGTMDFAQTCIGTPYYMSPEIFKNKPYSYKSDIWALGCVLYEMTTLCHAFDAQSLNGLAQKIIKGSYPSIHHKYSRYLKELIAEMLSTNANARPDTDQILRKPFIKKHIVNFFVGIASRPQQSLGDGTMIVRAAAGGPLSGFGGDANMLQFRQQLDDLGLNELIQRELNKGSLVDQAPPADPQEAKKLARDAANALKREEEHKRIVESALEKLKKERENRAKERERLLRLQRDKERNPAKYAVPSKRGISGSRVPGLGVGGISRADRGAEMHSNRSKAPDAPMLSARDRNEQHRARYPNQNESSSVERNPQRGRSIVEEQREKRRAAEIMEQEARKREQEARAREAADMRARESERLKAEAIREREEAAAKQKRDMMRAQNEAQRREQQLYLERERQRAAIEQLSRDKIELDRRVAEKDRRREEKLREEKQRLDDARAEQLNYYNRNGPDARADEKESSASAYEQVMARKRERQAKEEQQYYQQMKDVEEDNRNARAAAAINKQAVRGGPAPSYEFDHPAPKRDDIANALPGSRFESNSPSIERGEARVADVADDDDDDDDLDDDDEDEVDLENAPVDDAAEEEDLRNKEEELMAELNMATMRVSDLKQTLQNTKSYYDAHRADAGAAPRGATINKATKGSAVAQGLGPIASTMDSDEDDDEDDDEDRFDEEEEEEDEVRSKRCQHPS